MKKMNSWKTLFVTILLGAAPAVFAGPPLVCHTYEIGKAQSLPWTGPNFRDVKRDYDVKNLTKDTLGILSADTPIIVRMETIRRAAVYSVWSLRDKETFQVVPDDRYAKELLASLQARARDAEARGLKTRADILAVFDAGYYIETLKDAGFGIDSKEPFKLDGIAMVEKANRLLPKTGETEFALAKIMSHYRDRKADVESHLKLAAASAKEGTLLAVNIVNHFSDRGKSLAALR